MADLALNHRMAQGTLGGVVGGFDAIDLQEGPQPISHLEQLPAGANRFGPWRSLAALSAQLNHPLQRAHKSLADRLAVMLLNRHLISNKAPQAHGRPPTRR